MEPSEDMIKLLKIVNSRLFVVILMIAISPYWFTYVADRFVNKTISRYLAPSEEQKSNGAVVSNMFVDQSQFEIAEVLKKVDLEFLKIVPSKFGNKQKFIFRINNRSGYDLFSTTFNVEFYDEKGNILDVETITKLGNEVYFSGEEQTRIFSFDPQRISGKDRVDIGLAATAKAKIVWAESVSKSSSGS